MNVFIVLGLDVKVPDTEEEEEEEEATLEPVIRKDSLKVSTS